jgi:TP901 family phage tail tape measure protein
MAAPGLTIPTKFTATGDYVNNVNRMSNATDRMLNSLTRMDNVGRKAGLGMSDLTKSMLGYVKSAALVGGAFATARFSADSIMDYETAIQSLQSVTGSGDAQMVVFKKQISELGVTSKKSMIDIAGSFETVGSAMSQYLENPKALRQITEAGITLSKAARMDLQPSLESLTSVMNQFELSADKAFDVVNRLTGGEIVGSLKTSASVEYLKEFGGVAKGMNVDVAESVALMETLAIKLKGDKIGVGARNILTTISAAGGLDKKARIDMKKAGVDMNYLMDSSHSLSERLHELSKIGKDPIKMISVFGKENVAAANALFQQLGTYDRFVEKIRVTNDAEKQAATNSKTLAIAFTELKNKFSNLLNTNEDVGAGLGRTRSALIYLADHMEDILSVGAKLVGGFLLWKGAILAVRAATISYAAVSQVFFLVDMVKYVSITKGITMATAAYEVVMASLNTTMLLNPAYWLVGGLVALGGAMYLVNARTKELTEAYKKQVDLQMSTEHDKEFASLKKLTSEYWHLGQSIKEATENAIKFRLVENSQKRFKVESELKSINAELSKEKNKLYIGDLFTGAFGEGKAMYGKRSDLAEQSVAKQREAAILAQSSLTDVQFAKSQQDAGVIGGMNLNKYLYGNEQAPKQETNWSEQMGKSEQLKNFRFYEQKQTGNSNKMEIVINNQSGDAVGVKSAKGTKSVMPNTKSSFDTK